jgi:hypothetical protein
MPQNHVAAEKARKPLTLDAGTVPAAIEALRLF